MSLTKQDLTDIRDIVLDALDVAVNPRLDALEGSAAELKSDVAELKSDMREVKGSLSSLEGKVEALESDVKEMYRMIAELQKNTAPNKQFKKLTLEEKLLKINAELLAAAREAGISLPR